MMTNSLKDNDLYRLGVGMMMFNNQKQIFVAQRLLPIAKAWQMPQGGLEEGEDPVQGALRELKEETSVTSVKIIAETSQWYHYDIPLDMRLTLNVNRYRGQQQKWFALHFQGAESEINLNTATPEFKDWKWVSIDTLPILVIAFKQTLYRQIIQELWPAIDQYQPLA